METFRSDYYYQIKCNGCGKLTEVLPGDYTAIKSDCDCNKPVEKPKRTRKKKVTNEDKISKTDS